MLGVVVEGRYDAVMVRAPISTWRHTDHVKSFPATL